MNKKGFTKYENTASLHFKIKGFNLKNTLECGQCFRWRKQEKEEKLEHDKNETEVVLKYEYVGVINDRVIKIKQLGEEFFVWSNIEKDLKRMVFEYFDLNRDYQKIEEKISVIDDNVKGALRYSSGLHILNQPLFETLISYIISSNNNIKRISNSINNISERFGKKVFFENKEYSLFPIIKELAGVDCDDLKICGVGFRDKYIVKTINMIKNEKGLENLQKLKTEQLREELLRFPGVGPKVADCTMLFSTRRLEVFPIDVWVKRIMERLYFKQDTKLEEIKKYAQKNFGEFAGLVQQHLFYNIRMKKL